MINPFTLQSQIHRLQHDVMEPLYTMHKGQLGAKHDWLLAVTGKVIEANRSFLEEMSRSSLISTIFAVVKLFGGADQLSMDDFHRFTSYVNEGGLEAMTKMLLAADKEKVFLSQLDSLPPHIQVNARHMLAKSAVLHNDFIEGYLIQQYGSLDAAPKSSTITAGSQRHSYKTWQSWQENTPDSAMRA